jgi:hypothetical protein
MRRIALACLLLCAGCSSAPVADVMDRFFPGHLEPAPGYHGGVGAQQQIPAPLAPPLEGPRPVGPSGGGSLPPPVPPTEGFDVR